MDTGIGASRWRVRLEHLQWMNGLNVLECSTILYLLILALSASDAIITEMGKKNRNETMFIVSFNDGNS